MKFAPENSLMAKLAQQMESTSYDAIYFRPKDRCPNGATKFGTFPLYLRQLYMIRSASQIDFKALSVTHQSLLVQMKKYYPEATDTAAGLKVLLKAAKSPEFQDNLDRLEKIEAEIADKRMYGMFMEAVYKTEVWQKFPAARDKPFSVDHEWNVYHHSRQGPQGIGAVLAEALGLDEPDDD